MTAIERITISVLVAGFAVGTVTHTLHLVNIGWIVFNDAPTWMNVYWTTLTALDPLAAMLLIYRRPVGLALPFGFLPLQLQSLFCGFLLGAVGFLAAKRDAGEANR